MSVTAAMIDIETLATSDDAVILTIGAVKFDPNGDRIYGHKHYKLDIDDQLEKGRIIDDSTMKWWEKQDESVIESTFSTTDRMQIETALRDFYKWCKGVDLIWAQGITFDIPLLEHIFKQYGIATPWKYYQVRDSRTLFGILPKDPRLEYNFSAHDALEDAKIQARCVQSTLQKLKLNLD